ncbi:bestrophin family ion channel [Galbibacter sp. EGI 63066]|uniref:bestrophin family protein n=1 Tax=Galbibacter sp. EGI 63066 TaxID=2993559 RepID=UPI00224906B7|nr:bestrophin family ion channel [Galbibacter sp. EGI 63066]MCX2681235.1 bestrophin family ion channel [Galbibacter sp. EGI 63066]
MLTKKRYSVKDLFLWSRWETFLFLLYALIITVAYHILGYTFLHVPWTPVALVGTAVAFLVGFQNNSAYGRIWEARKIWGGIVNTSRTFGMKVQAMVSNEYCDTPVSEEELNHHKKTLIYRHIAWMTALRYAMRQTKDWETFRLHRTNREWQRKIYIPEFTTSLKDDLSMYLEDHEMDYVLSKNNKQTALLYLQSKHLKALKEQGLLWEFSFLELENVLETLFDHQGKSERIKNFPYPRQYAALSYYLVFIFLFLLPFGIVPEFANISDIISETNPLIGRFFVWMAIPLCGAVSWAFHIMERLARVGENPFEGSSNDVPISTIARGIEIDLRQMLDEDFDIIPGQFPEKHHVQM